MCPSRINPTPAPRIPPQPPQQKRNPRETSNHRPAPKQHTIWNFIYLKLPSAPQQTAANATNLATETPNPTITLTPPVTKPPTTDEDPQLAPLQQSSLDKDPSNAPWGDHEQYYQPHDNFRVLSKNVNTLQPQSLDMTAMAVELQHSNTSVFMIQETNTAWKPLAVHSIHAQCSRVHRHVKIATSSSQDNTNAKHHPSGTLTAVLGKWASRVIHSGTDEVLGRWSYLELVGQQGKRLIVASAYRVCPQQFDATAMTATAQQS